ncbi:MAG: carbohydrate kinase family protein [Opitutaceae bacterium]|nr:carbohydrate kinase family protein [Opitutaceae bacterium]MBP9913385.1 carbohydrate kinase family protein [Opitutaceae bacterium]
MTDIGCVGILVEDTICGPMAELPREGLLLAIDAMPVKAGGCAANVAIDLAKQGLAVDIVGCLGRDSAAQVLTSTLEKHRIGCSQMVYTDAYPTSKTVILLVEGQDRRYIHVFGANRALTVAQINREWVAGLKIFYLGGLFAMPGINVAELRELLQFCRDRQIITVVDVVVPQQWTGAGELTALLPHIDYFLPNDDEAVQITGLTEPLAQLRYLQAAGAHTVIITQGKAGAIAARGGQYWHCGAHTAKAVDPSGSGDAFSSGIITAIHRGWDMPRMLAYASALGVSATRVVGTTDGVFTAAEAEAFAATHPLAVAEGLL